ncbi:GGDEF domain-containing protein [Aliikangiella coralliicola]|uniref:diguanylate cyclase n=1 Tax=Aliikangiella coralliicola TaxID=2592383 RepID=A0A545UJ75_9GAMM|nr:GGDEF domain-containing protein [Aliikangiella coralliicola]TQV89524.1 GGDEF domain-containing protein [Aliikangiella coralliicola]
MDTFTLTIFRDLIALQMILVLFILRRQNRDYVPTKYWLLFAIFYFIQGLIFKDWPGVPKWLVLLSGNSIVILANVMLAMGYVKALHLERTRRFICSVAVVFLIYNGLSIALEFPARMRITPLAFLLGIIDLRVAYEIIRLPREQLFSYVKLIFVLFLLLALIYLCRSVGIFLSLKSNVLFVPNTVDQLTLMMSTIVMITLAFSANLLVTGLHQQKLKMLAQYDSLTAIFNRRTFFEKARAICQRLQNNNETFYILLVDVDKFKLINDELGHLAGDVALKGIANILAKNLRPNDIIGRYGGEEFIALLVDSTQQQAEQVAERLRSRVSETHFEYSGKVMKLTISIGVASNRQKSELEKVTKYADEALYESKKNGRNLVTVHSA